MRLQSRVPPGFACFFVVLAACGGGDGPADSHGLPGYLASDACGGHTDAEACAGAGCEWLEIEACPAGADCARGGVCASPDPCRAHGDEASCVADADHGCAWAGVESLCPAGAACADGFCYAAGDGDCACVCPLYCPAGEDCPPCECDCAPSGGGGSGGGTCSCECPACSPGEECPPCSCDCSDDGGCVDDGTCTCVCPSCEEGTECPPCECGCEPSGGSSGGADPGDADEPDSPPPTTPTCECAECPPGESCPPCDCGTADPCSEHVDETTCSADTANECSWIALGIPCSSDEEECRSGVCQGPSSGGGDDCTCVCPDCAPGEACPPCSCDCSGGGGGGGCVPGGEGDGGDAPPPEGGGSEGEPGTAG
jgi:hypothetical protein